MANEEIKLDDEVPTVQELTRLTVNLLPVAMGSLTMAAEMTQKSRTDTVNRALQVYSLVLLVEKGGGEFFMRRGAEEEEINFSKM